MILAGCASRPFPELAASLVDCDGGVAALVRVDPQNHHGPVSLHDGATRTGRRAHLSGGDATLLSSHSGRSGRPRWPHKRTKPKRQGVVERASGAGTDADTDGRGVRVGVERGVVM